MTAAYTTDGRQVRQTMTYKPDEGMTPKQIEREANKRAVLFEQECIKGQVITAVKFQTLAEELLNTYAKQNLRQSTYEGYLKYVKRVYSAIGHMNHTKTSLHI